MNDNRRMMGGILALLLALSLAWVLEWIILDLAITVFSFTVFLLLFYFLQDYRQQFMKIDQLRSLGFYFMNQFILTLSVKNTIAATLSELYPSLHPLIKKALDEDEGLPAKETLLRLQVLFTFPLYAIFLHMIDIHLTYGGSIIDMTDMLLSKARREEIEWNERHLYRKKKAGQFSLLWFLNFGMLFFIRFGLQEIFQSVFSTVIFKVLILLFFGLFLFSLGLFFLHAYPRSIHGNS